MDTDALQAGAAGGEDPGDGTHFLSQLAHLIGISHVVNQEKQLHAVDMLAQAAEGQATVVGCNFFRL